MINSNIQSGERLSFFKLFSEKNFRVLIPIIQRDYAQGRESTKEIRNTFLDSLHKYLEDNKPGRDLDFVYGSLNHINGKTDFIPLDGQQRLTTLFLLHWYLNQISTAEQQKSKLINALLKDGKSMFTYETRPSSSEFCDALMNSAIDFGNLLPPCLDNNGNSKENELSKTIRNSSWFFLSWKYDPTIQSMLTMLDAIHKKFGNKPEFFERLLDEQNPIITFLFLNLKDFKLTDDLYIKMNSRGKPLSPFENFKAKFEQFLEKEKINGRTYKLKYGETEKVASLKEYFSFNIDTKWANLFWHYRELQNPFKTDVDTFDNELMNFIRVVFSNQYAMQSKAALNEKDENLEYLLGTAVARKDKNYSDVISYSKYEQLGVLSNEAVLYLVDALDALVNGNSDTKITSVIPQEYSKFFNVEKAFEKALKHSFETNHERICFHAYLRYLIQNQDDLSGIGAWMRVIHNLTHPENTVIDNASEVAAAIRSIEDLLPYSKNILNHLTSNPSISLFSSWQVLEEKIKAHLITKNKRWENKILEVEQHGYFIGQIGFLLEFSGILGFYLKHSNCNWTALEDADYFKKFLGYSEKASKIFDKNYDNRINNPDLIFERAVLTKGDYLTDASQYRRNLLSTNLVKNNIKRDHSWKRLLRISDVENWIKRRDMVKQVFDDERFDKDNVVGSLKAICKDKTDTWRDYFIKNPALMSYCKQGFIRFEGDNNILLYSESQSNHMHAEMYTYQLWKESIEPNKEQFLPFTYIRYYEVRSIDDEACISFSGFCHNKVHYQIEIYFCDSDDIMHPYEIKFIKSKGENKPEKYGKDIYSILEQCNFVWYQEFNGFFYSCKTNSRVIKKLKEVVAQINTLQ